MNINPEYQPKGPPQPITTAEFLMLAFMVKMDFEELKDSDPAAAAPLPELYEKLIDWAASSEKGQDGESDRL